MIKSRLTAREYLSLLDCCRVENCTSFEQAESFRPCVADRGLDNGVVYHLDLHVERRVSLAQVDRNRARDRGKDGQTLEELHAVVRVRPLIRVFRLFECIGTVLSVARVFDDA